MPLTAILIRAEDIGLGQRIVADVTFDASYAGDPGEVITAALLGFRVGAQLDSVEATPRGGLSFEYKPGSLADRGTLAPYGRNSQDIGFSKPLLAIGVADPAEVLISNDMRFLVAAANAELTAAEHAFSSGGGDDIANDADDIREASYLLSTVDGTNVVITKGAEAVGVGSSLVPATPSNAVAIGYVRVAVAAGATPFDATSDLLSAAHLTVSFIDLLEGGLSQVGSGVDLSDVTTRVVAYGR